MQLTFEEVAVIGNGSYPDFVQYERNENELFFLDGNKMYGVPTKELDSNFKKLEWGDTFEIESKQDINLSNLELKTLSGFGIAGSYKAGNTHKLVIYEFAFEMDKYLNKGNIKHTTNNPISSFNLALKNPKVNILEQHGNIVSNQKRALLSPASKVLFRFEAGSEFEYDMGTLYIDGSSFILQNETASTHGRNLIGRALRDKTLDENYDFSIDYLHEILRKLLQHANLTNNQSSIQSSSSRDSFVFKPDTNVLQAIEEILINIPKSKIKELTDGTIVIGDNNYSVFEQAETYTFYRDKDIFSNQIVLDDNESYGRVCVHDANFNIIVYKDVINPVSNLQANKTLYVKVPDGTTESKAQDYANKTVEQLSTLGETESFIGAFMPQIKSGDNIVIINDDGVEYPGLITEVTHEFGKKYFYTSLKVDFD